MKYSEFCVSMAIDKFKKKLKIHGNQLFDSREIKGWKTGLEPATLRTTI